VFLASLIDDPSATVVVTQAAARPDVALRVEAAAAARHLPADVVDAMLDNLAGDPHPGVRKTAIESAGMVATDALRHLVNDVAATDPVGELRDLARSIAKRLGSGAVADYQKKVDDVTRRAKRRPYARTRSETVLTDNDIDFLGELYGAIALAGRVVAPEASQLLRRYMRSGTSGVEDVPGGIYEDSPRVQVEIDWHKARIARAAKAGKVPLKGGDSTLRSTAKLVPARRATPRAALRSLRGCCWPTTSASRKANNRFYLQSYTVRRPESDTP
jgi:hypothetical protein